MQTTIQKRPSQAVTSKHVSVISWPMHAYKFLVCLAFLQLAATERPSTSSPTSVIAQCDCFALVFYFSLSIMAPRPFALVRWVEDPEPSCWQVIKTTQITSDRDNIVEGKAVDAIWKKSRGNCCGRNHKTRW